MAEKEPTVSWQVLLDDAQWEREANAPVSPKEDTLPRRRWVLPRRWLLLGLFVLLLALLSTGLLLWQRAQSGLADMEREIEKAARLEANAQSQHNSRLAAALLDPGADPEWRQRIVEHLMADDSAPPVPVVGEMEWVDGVALVHLSSTDPDLPLPSRSLRFYRESAGGWLRTSPVASFWGAAENWEGQHFSFRFQARDRAAVLSAGPQVEAVYLALRQDLGLPILPTRRVVVVRPDDRPAEFDFPTGELRHPSPQLLELPAGISDESALFRSLTLYLINELVRESFDRYAYGQVWMWSNLTESGLRNWLQLQSGLLAIDRRLLLPWLLDREAQVDRQFPEGVAEACQLMDGLDVRVLLLSCTPDLHASLPNRSSVLRLSRLTTTYDFDFTRDANTSSNPSGPMWRAETRQEIVAATTVFAYAVETYGVERLPAFLEALGIHRGWTGVLPAAYGVSVEEFEAGWRGWLAAEFGVGE
ncbi:MAG: hypothetical protein KJZ86_15115 [Caldilineaceae bacterium]|nr:hypothetical protein [Caldilineaceae bacterium]